MAKLVDQAETSQLTNQTEATSTFSLWGGKNGIRAHRSLPHISSVQWHIIILAVPHLHIFIIIPVVPVQTHPADHPGQCCLRAYSERVMIKMTTVMASFGPVAHSVTWPCWLDPGLLGRTCFAGLCFVLFATSSTFQLDRTPPSHAFRGSRHTICPRSRSPALGIGRFVGLLFDSSFPFFVGLQANQITPKRLVVN